MKRLFLTGLGLATVLAFAGVGDAFARNRYSNAPLLVTPDGAILDFIPHPSEATASRDDLGRRIYIDRWGNLLATELSDDGYLPDALDRFPPAPGRGNSDYGSNNGYDGGYQDFREYRMDEPGAVTGTVPDRGSVSRLPLEEQPMPSRPSESAALEPSYRDNGGETRSSGTIAVTRKSRAEMAALQVFLDREGISPGVIDGLGGSNVNKAIAAWQEMTGETLDPNNAEDILRRLSYSGGLPIIDYRITAADAAGPFVAEIPSDYALKAQLPAMSYTSVSEKLAERFHMDEAYLKLLNPGVDFTIPGTTIKVVNVGAAKTGHVTRIVADKGRKQVFAYGADGALIAAYPATIGSSATPSPTGVHTVQRIALDPGYTYNPKINFKQGDNDQILQIPPGPNGPVGNVWIALSKPTYGIHGTPEPSKIGKNNSNGCIRLTNWDATELAKMVKPGTVVEFME